MTATDRITLVVLNPDGTREKFTLSSWVGIPRKHELLWIGDDPYMVIEVEYAVSEGFFGARSIEAAGLYVRRLTDEEQRAVARRLANPTKGKDEQPFRPCCGHVSVLAWVSSPRLPRRAPSVLANRASSPRPRQRRSSRRCRSAT